MDITITDRTWARLQRMARPLVDSAEDVVNRALDALEAQQVAEAVAPIILGQPAESKPKPKPPRFTKKAMEPLVLLTLAELGGHAKTREVLAILAKKVAAELGATDVEQVALGEPRWRNTARWTRATLVEQGLLLSAAKRGVWALSAKGRRAAAQLAKTKTSPPERQPSA